jgi:D-glycero-D-manno-heptose 1,7-bisphosphate phosphatase
MPDVATPPRPTAFLDRDGVLNVDTGYIWRAEELQFVPDAPEAVRMLNDAAYRVVVVTNQSGIARGLYDEAAVHALHAHMQEQLGAHGARIDAFYHCPHHPEGSVAEFAIECDCRKPKAGLLDRAAQDCPVDHARSFLIGDREGDISAAAAFGIRGFLFDWRKQSLRELVDRLIDTR